MAISWRRDNSNDIWRTMACNVYLCIIGNDIIVENSGLTMTVIQQTSYYYFIANMSNGISISNDNDYRNNVTSMTF